MGVGVGELEYLEGVGNGGIAKKREGGEEVARVRVVDGVRFIRVVV